MNDGVEPFEMFASINPLSGCHSTSGEAALRPLRTSRTTSCRSVVSKSISACRRARANR